MAPLVFHSISTLPRRDEFGQINLHRDEQSKIPWKGIVCFGTQQCTLIGEFGAVEITVTASVNEHQHEGRGTYDGEVKDGSRHG